MVVHADHIRVCHKEYTLGHTITSTSTVPVPWDDTLLEVSGYALLSCDLLIQKITTNIIATMAIINTAAPTAAPIIAPLTDPELSLLTEEVDDYNTHNIIWIQKFIMNHNSGS